MIVHPPWLRLCALATLLGVAGCGGGLSTATGKVTYKGAPVKGAVVVFVPKDPMDTSQRSSGTTGEDGVYHLTTGKLQGVPAGDYLVSVTWIEYVKQKGKPGKGLTQPEEEEVRDRLRGRYADPAKSGLTATIKSGNNAVPTFELN